eukprot:14790769-Heterocapsa_arctica.AAC.1
MDPDHLARERIMNPNHGNNPAPTKQDILNIFEFCTEIHRSTPIMGTARVESGMHNRGVKEALITL